MALANEYMLEELTAEEIYQKKLTAGTNITIDNQNVISATGGGSSVQYTSNYAQGDILGTLSIDGASSAVRTPNLVEGENITITRNQQAGTITISSSAGLGDLSAHELTEEAYNVLTPAEKTNGELYLTHPATVGSSEPNKIYYNDTLYGTWGENANRLILDAQIYSEDERQIGVWIDGRPLYQKTFERNVTLASGQWAPTGDSIQDGKAIDAEVTAISAGSDTVPVWCEIGSDGHIELLNIRTAGSVTITHYTIRYYKSSDSAGSGGYQAYGFSPIIYSEEEREVGVWIDNKPLYQKTIDKSLSVVTNHATTLGILGTKESGISIKNYTGFFLTDSTFYSYSYYKDSSNWFTATLTANNDDLNVKPEMNVSTTVYAGIITIWYTKDSDVAGSGSYNTLGVPMTHIDGSEQVVGTLFGETLYQKSFQTTVTVTSTARAWYTLVTSSQLRVINADKVLIDATHSFIELNDSIINLNYSSIVNAAGGTAGCSYASTEDEVQVCLYGFTADTYPATVTIQYTKSTN